MSQVSDQQPVDKAQAADEVSRLISQLSSEDGFARQNARQALVGMGNPVIDRLVAALSLPYNHVHWEATKALSELCDPAAAPALVELLEDSEFSVRWLAAQGLASLGLRGLTPLLRALLNRSGSVWLQEGAHHVMSELAKRGLRETVSPVLQALEDVEPALQVPKAAETVLSRLSQTTSV